MLAALLALLGLIPAPPIQMIQMSKPAGGGVVGSTRSSQVFRWQLLSVSLAAWYLERRTTIGPQDFATAAQPKGLVVPGKQLPQAAVDDDVAVEDEALAGGLEALASSQNWRRPETQLSDTACTHGANCSRVLPAGGCSPAVAVNGRSLAGDGGKGRSPAGEGGSGSAQVQRGSAPPATLQHPGGMLRSWGGFDCRACGKAFPSNHALLCHLIQYPSHKAAPGWVAPAAPEVRSTSSIVDRAGPDSNQAILYRANMQDFMVQSRGELRYNKGVSVANLERVRDAEIEMMDRVKAELLKGVRRGSNPAELEAMVGRVCNVFCGIECTELEDEVRAKALRAQQPVRRTLIDPMGNRHGDVCYDVPIDERLQWWLQNDRKAWDHVQRAQQAWQQAPPPAGTGETVYVDITCGSVVRSHPELGDEARRKCALSGGDNTIRLKLILYYDEVEICNPLGYAAGKHKLGLFYFALVDLPPNLRMALHNIQLATVCLDKDFSYYGPTQIICGPPGEQRLKGTSIGAAMERLDSGREIYVPDGPHSMVPRTFKAWAICLAADYPAAGLVV